MRYEVLQDFEYTPDHGGTVISMEAGGVCDGDSMPTEKLRRLVTLGFLAEGEPEGWPEGVPESAIEALEGASYGAGDIPALSDEQLLEVENIGPKAVDKIRAAFNGE